VRAFVRSPSAGGAHEVTRHTMASFSYSVLINVSERFQRSKSGKSEEQFGAKPGARLPGR
jgi:hypothetical protein